MTATETQILSKNFSSSERPRERCLSHGSRCLSLRECLALIINIGPPQKGCLGLAEEILSRSSQGIEIPAEEERAFFTALEASGGDYLSEISGLGPAIKARLMASFELGRRYALFRNGSQIKRGRKIRYRNLTSQVLTRISRELRNESREWLGFVPFYRSGDLGELCVVERGVRTHVNVDPAELFARVLALRPQGFFLFHNHPSGGLVPSLPDLDLTSHVRETAQRLGIQLLGHGIITSESERMI